MQKLSKKIVLMSLIFSLAFGFYLNVEATSGTDYTPTVAIKKAKSTSVTLKVVSPNLKKKDVKIKVKIKNVDADTDETKVFEKKLNKSGKADIKITGLSQDIEYSFKVAIKKSSDDDYSDFADEVIVNAEGTYDYNPVLSVEDTNKNSIVLRVSSAKLKKKKVKIKIRIENEDTDKIETRVFTKNLSKNGNVDIVIDKLTANTDYAFKAVVKKKSKDKGFSEYSNEETSETEK